MINKGYDLVIVGAGIVGVLSAYYACKNNNNLKVLLIDRGLISSGTTSNSLGMEFRYGQSVKKLLYAEEGVYEWKKIRQEIKDIKFFKKEFLGIISNGKFDDFRESPLNKHFNTPTNPNKYKEYFKNTKIDFNNYSLLSSNYAGYSNVIHSCYKIIDYCKKNYNGFTLMESIDIKNLECSNNKIALMTSDGRTFISEYCILAVGPWILNQVFKNLVNKVKLKLKKVVSFELKNNNTNNLPLSLIYFFDHDAFLMSKNDDEYYLSIHSNQYFLGFDRNKIDINIDDYNIAKKIINTFFNKNNFSILGGKVFMDVYTPNCTPLILNPISNYKLSVITACSGSGFRLAPALALESLRKLNMVS